MTSPQGRFVQGAALLDGHVLTESAAHGKHLFLGFEHGLVLHVHLGLYGAWDFGGDASFRRGLQHRRARKIGEREAYPDDGPIPSMLVRRRRSARSGCGWRAGTAGRTCAGQPPAKR